MRSPSRDELPSKPEDQESSFEICHLSTHADQAQPKGEENYEKKAAWARMESKKEDLRNRNRGESKIVTDDETLTRAVSVSGHSTSSIKWRAGWHSAAGRGDGKGSERDFSLTLPLIERDDAEGALFWS